MNLFYFLASINRKFPFPYCKICGEMPSKIGNYTNMELAKIRRPRRFDKKYGLMCAKHAGELTESLIKDLKLTDEDIKIATHTALEKISEEMSRIAHL